MTLGERYIYCGRCQVSFTIRFYEISFQHVAYCPSCGANIGPVNPPPEPPLDGFPKLPDSFKTFP